MLNLTEKQQRKIGEAADAYRQEMRRAEEGLEHARNVDFASSVTSAWHFAIDCLPTGTVARNEAEEYALQQRQRRLYGEIEYRNQLRKDALAKLHKAITNIVEDR